MADYFLMVTVNILVVISAILYSLYFAYSYHTHQFNRYDNLKKIAWLIVSISLLASSYLCISYSLPVLNINLLPMFLHNRIILDVSCLVLPALLLFTAASVSLSLLKKTVLSFIERFQFNFWWIWFCITIPFFANTLIGTTTVIMAPIMFYFLNITQMAIIYSILCSKFLPIRFTFWFGIAIAILGIFFINAYTNVIDELHSLVWYCFISLYSVFNPQHL
jgi:hypothetical protein